MGITSWKHLLEGADPLSPFIQCIEWLRLKKGRRILDKRRQRICSLEKQVGFRGHVSVISKGEKQMALKRFFGFSGGELMRSEVRPCSRLIRSSNYDSSESSVACLRSHIYKFNQCSNSN
ncbi:hypothetical protein K2173_027729 [Erythroxylum novogranatense]|uniref:DUF7875 domain-containing protein n=1 Tax=Erythroxylum novogranatense TaxID=1862640 RepID=A0AAV8TZT3_9ROSI|nr:hypothetical protein K2173_027729 [Erythroxylum novogranatense]